MSSKKYYFDENEPQEEDFLALMNFQNYLHKEQDKVTIQMDKYSGLSSKYNCNCGFCINKDLTKKLP